MIIDNTGVVKPSAEKILWVCKSFEQLTNTELYCILRLRSEVFVVEQNCVYLDADGIDLQSLHLCGWQGSYLAAYCRLLSPGLAFTEASIGRVITAPGHRGTGLGKLLMQEAIQQAQKSFGTQKIRISAQYHLLEFYRQLGFQPVGEVYLEDDIPHIAMLLAVEN